MKQRLFYEGKAILKRYISFGKKILEPQEIKEESDQVEEKIVQDSEGGSNADQSKKSAQPEKAKDIFQRIVTPEERTIRNYLSISFWAAKRDVYSKIREKEQQDLGLYQTLSMGARPSTEYYILTVLSCIIATTGLIQGSTATIIGAMIVAPLMTPILAFSLGIIWGDIYLIRTSLESLFKGIMLAILISAAIAFVVPIPEYSPEIMSRTQPTLFDIVVALGSGLVGAYGNANKRVSNTLVGIAIAVAIMPPLCTIGIGLGDLNMTVAGGAAILFLINLISISLAGAIVFWVMKIQPLKADQAEVQKRAIYQIILSIIILIGIAVPVSFYMLKGYNLSKSKSITIETIQKQLSDVNILQIDTKRDGFKYIVFITLSGENMPDKNEVRKVKETIMRNTHSIKSIHLRFLKSVPVDE